MDYEKGVVVVPVEEEVCEAMGTPAKWWEDTYECPGKLIEFGPTGPFSDKFMTDEFHKQYSNELAKFGPFKYAAGDPARLPRMTDEEYRLYAKQVEKSDGFDVKEIDGVNMSGMILPTAIDKKSRFLDYDMCSQRAILEYMHRFKDKNIQLEFVKVLMVMCEPANCARFYITFEAKDLVDGDKIKIYQAVVLLEVGGTLAVSSFRLKPPEDEQGTGKKEWFWETHLCHGCRD